MLLINKAKQYLYKLGLLVITTAILAIPLVLWQLYFPHQIASFNQFIQAKSLFFAGLRWIFIAIFIWQWPRLIHYFAHKQHWDLEKLQFWLSKRISIALWLIIIEVVVCENLILSLVKAFGG